MIRTVVRRSCRCRARSTAKADSDTISSTFPNSDGWNWKNGSGIQRVAPATRGMPSTTTFKHDHQPVEDDPVLAQPRVVETRKHEREHQPRAA